MSSNEQARQPEDLTRLFVARANDGDAAGIAALYGARRDGLPTRPPDRRPRGDPELWEKVLANAPRFEPEAPLPTLVAGDIALTSTAPDGTGARAQVARRQPEARGSACSTSPN